MENWLPETGVSKTAMGLGDNTLNFQMDNQKLLHLSFGLLPNAPTATPPNSPSNEEKKNDAASFDMNNFNSQYFKDFAPTKYKHKFTFEICETLPLF